VAGNVPPKTKVVIKLVDDELTFEKITLEE
jgi:hypothetical protein